VSGLTIGEVVAADELSRRQLVSKHAGPVLAAFVNPSIAGSAALTAHSSRRTGSTAIPNTIHRPSLPLPRSLERAGWIDTHNLSLVLAADEKRARHRS